MSHKVYRYENPLDKMGPYTCSLRGIDGVVCEALAKSHAGDEKRPSAREDGLDFIMKTNGFRLACNSLESLKTWFKGYNKRLIESGFVLAEYEVEHLFLSNSGLQCAFHLNAVKERKVIPLF